VLDTFGLPGLYTLAVVIGVVGAPSSTVAYVKVLSGWFDKTRGLAMGFAMSGIALGGAITPFYASTLIGAFGWRAGFYGLALLPLIVGLIVTGILHEAPHVGARSDRSGVPGLTQAQALRTRVFWMLMLLFLVAATAIHGIQIHLAPLLSDLGLTPDKAALGVSFMFTISVVMRLVAGYLFDRVFAPYIGALCFLSAAIGAGMLVAMSGPVGLLLAVALLGVGAGAESDLMGYLVSRYFGLKAYGAIFGWTSGALMVGSALGPALLGFGYDATASYASSLVWCTGGLVVTALLLAMLPRYPEFDSSAPFAPREPAAVPAE
jgi:MFS family permease